MAYALFFSFFFFNDTATTEIYTLSLHDALPISERSISSADDSAPQATTTMSAEKLIGSPRRRARTPVTVRPAGSVDRKSTRLNSSHANISYAVFCLKKKKTQTVNAQSINKDN